MGERWHSTKALVGRPGIVGGERNIKLWGPGKGYVSRLNGNRLEWLESSLPAEAQKDFARERATTGAAEGEVTAAPVPKPAPSLPTGPRARLGMARSWYVTAFADHHRAAGGPVMEAMRNWCGACKAGDVPVPDWVATAVKPPAWNTLQGWRNARAKDGIAGLAGSGGRKPGGGVIDSDPELRDFVVAHIAAKPLHINGPHIFGAMQVRFPQKALPDLRTVQRWIERWRAENARLLSLWSNPDAHRSKYRPAFGHADADVTRANQVWELDGSPADVACIDGNYKRAAAYDVATGRAMIVVGRTSSAALNAALLRRCLIAWGKPERVRTDRGPDFVSLHIRAILDRLGAEHELCDPDAPYQKPHVERFFRTLAVDVDERLPGFKGHSIEQQQAIRKQKTHAARRGEAEADIFGVELSADELQARYDDWIEAIYHQRPHAGLDGRTPAQAASGHSFVQIDERMLDALLAEPAKGGAVRTVKKDGLSIEGGIYSAVLLGGMIGDKVEVRLDPADRGRVWVFDLHGSFLCEAVDLARLGEARRELAIGAGAEARRTDSAGRKLRNDIIRRHRPGDSFGEQLDAARQAIDASNIVPLPARALADDSHHSREAARAVESASEWPETAGETTAPDPAALAFMRRRMAELEAEAEQARLAQEQEEEELRALARDYAAKAGGIE